MIKKTLLIATTALFISSPALAQPKPWIFSWWPSHFAEEEKDEISALGDLEGKDSHPRQWDMKKWNPDVWIQQEKGGMNLIEGFYQAGILEDQTYKDEIPYLHIGPNFYKLSGYDKKRIIQSVDEVYGITNIETDDLFYVYDPYMKEIIGIYSKYGYQVQ